MTDATLTLAVCQADAELAGAGARFDWLYEQVRAAQSNGAQLVIFPELFSSGYNVGARLHQFAETPDGNFARRVKALAAELNLAIVYGYPERDGDIVYNSMLFIGPGGQVLANHRKTALPDGIEPQWFEPGHRLTMLEFGGIQVALLICYESEFPEAVRQVTAAGAELVLVCTACNFDQVPNFVIPSRAFENGVFIAYANYAGIEHGHPFSGLSCIVDPYGIDLARTGKSAECIHATLDFSLVTKARTRLPYLRDHKKIPPDMHHAGEQKT